MFLRHYLSLPTPSRYYCTGLLSGTGTILAKTRGHDDELNTVLSGTMSGLLFKSTGLLSTYYLFLYIIPLVSVSVHNTASICVCTYSRAPGLLLTSAALISQLDSRAVWRVERLDLHSPLPTSCSPVRIELWLWLVGDDSPVDGIIGNPDLCQFLIMNGCDIAFFFFESFQPIFTVIMTSTAALPLLICLRSHYSSIE